MPENSSTVGIHSCTASPCCELQYCVNRVELYRVRGANIDLCFERSALSSCEDLYFPHINVVCVTNTIYSHVSIPTPVRRFARHTGHARDKLPWWLAALDVAMLPVPLVKRNNELRSGSRRVPMRQRLRR